MAYQALYRRWRPRRFADIVGQEHVTRTLQNALLAGRLTHAYLFCGPRGTGKTTTAQVLARALNCRSRQGAEPCNECPSCREITAGTSMDVAEIDAASHRGIDEIRELREKVRFMPAGSRYRVYIIDEVHMLTSEAFNALLKTLEEPPAHVVFILATTEPHKVPLTIISRCQRFDFHRIGLSEMVDYLKKVAAGADLVVEDSALYLIARVAEGGLRDALGVLDQAAAFAGGRITARDIHQILGTVREEMLDEVAAALAEGRSDRLLGLVAALVDQGKDLLLFTRSVTAFLRNLLLWHAGCREEPVVAPAEGERVGALAGRFTREQLLHVLHILTRAEQEMKWASQPRILLEVALVEAVHTAGDGSLVALQRRVAELERRLDHLTGMMPVESEAAAGREGEGEGSPPAGGTGDTARKREELPPLPRREGDAENAGEERGSAGTPGEDGGAGAGNRPGDIRDGREQRGTAAHRAGNHLAGADTAGTPLQDRNAQAVGDDAVDKSDAGSKNALRLKDMQDRWEQIVDVVRGISRPVSVYLARSWPQQVEGYCLTVAFEQADPCKDRMESPENRRVLEQALAVLFPGQWEVRVSCGSGGAPPVVKRSLEEQVDAAVAIDLFGGEEVELDRG
ncbi:MAG: DNA polymerase III subunit gamma/tau [Thermoanaerobacteraceae bacterium]|nr:DNA polymerase III subunit gamma/tau [Thermoanaerobacteraceae bacterium]